MTKIENHLHTAPDEWGMPQFTPFWGSNMAAPSAGVAILFRTSRINNQSNKIHFPHADIDGRLMHLKIECGGHSIRLINSYLPSSYRKGQKDFMISRLVPLLQSLDPSESPHPLHIEIQPQPVPCLTCAQAIVICMTPFVPCTCQQSSKILHVCSIKCSNISPWSGLCII